MTDTFFLNDEAIDAAALPDVLVYGGLLAPGATSVSSPVLVVEVLFSPFPRSASTCLSPKSTAS